MEESQLSCMPETWKALPDLVLGKIFGYLSNADRASASAVCMSWCYALNYPPNWRVMQIHLDHDFRSTDTEPVVFQLTRWFGHHIRSLELVWPQAHANRDVSRRIQIQAGIKYLETLNDCQVKIQEIVFTDWIHSYKWPYRRKFINAIIRFLSTQNKIEKISLRNGCLAVNEVNSIIMATLKGSESLKKLDLCNAFRAWNVPYNDDKFLEMFASLKALTALHLDYGAVSDKTLQVLTHATNGTLTILQIVVRENDNRHHRLSNEAWKTLRVACPKLQVGFKIVNIARYEEMDYLLLPSVPLHSFVLFGGRVWDQRQSRNLRSTLEVLLTHYTHMLEIIHLQLKNNREILDDLILEILRRCTNLASFQYDGVVTSLSTIAEICSLQVNSETNFKVMHVQPRLMNNSNYQTAQDIHSKFNRDLALMDVDFKLNNNYSPVLMFT